MNERRETRFGAVKRGIEQTSGGTAVQNDTEARLTTAGPMYQHTPTPARLYRRQVCWCARTQKHKPCVTSFFFFPAWFAHDADSHANGTVDYRSEDRENVGELGGNIGAIRQGLHTFFHETRSSLPKKR